MNSSKKPLPAIVIIAILTVITTFVWVGLEVYRALTEEPAPSVPAHITAPLSPALDTEVLSTISRRVHLEDEQIEDIVIEAPVGVIVSSPQSATPAPEPVADEEVDEEEEVDQANENEAVETVTVDEEEEL